MSDEQEQAATEEEAENTEHPGAEPEGDQPEQQPAEQPAEPEASGFQKRINKVTAEKYEYRRRAEAAERELQKHSQQPPRTPKSVPSLESFDYDEDRYREALIDYKVDQRFQQAQESRRQRRQQEQQSEAAKDFAKKIALSKVPDDYSDKIDKMSESVVFEMDVVSAIQHADNGPQLAYYLAENLDIADDVSRMNPIQAALEIGKISAQLSANKPTTKPASKAPNPVKTVKPRGGRAKNIYDPEDEVSMSEVMVADD